MITGKEVRLSKVKVKAKQIELKGGRTMNDKPEKNEKRKRRIDKLTTEQ